MTNLFWTSRLIYLRMKKFHMHVIPLLFLLICKLINRYFISGIPLNNKINQFISPHGFSGIFISKSAVIGNNCTIFQQVTIGRNDIETSKHYGTPVIGNNVYWRWSKNYWKY